MRSRGVLRTPEWLGSEDPPGTGRRNKARVTGYCHENPEPQVHRDAARRFRDRRGAHRDIERTKTRSSHRIWSRVHHGIRSAVPRQPIRKMGVVTQVTIVTPGLEVYYGIISVQDNL
jgi:hypothetical protein